MKMTTIIAAINRAWLPLSALLLMTITILSLYPLTQLPDIPGTDKTHHIIAYMVLAFPCALNKPKRWWLILLLFIFYGGFIELVQPYVNRYGEWLDFLANTGGVLCGAILGRLTNKFYDVSS